ncbi:hypothetical protein NDN08_001877 [Rhodosorus marinus]|uniref:Nuclear pore complex protein Nup85 n=1 Tax=Rhodosorus marinus TaxID=101924 RepID=A0AAV8US39_9RHOD|nr:hypothetical protein NDN08_001877 [Rhodosorus marinus]
MSASDDNEDRWLGADEDQFWNGSDEGSLSAANHAWADELAWGEKWKELGISDDEGKILSLVRSISRYIRRRLIAPRENDQKEAMVEGYLTKDLLLTVSYDTDLDGLLEKVTRREIADVLLDTLARIRQFDNDRATNLILESLCVTSIAVFIAVWIEGKEYGLEDLSSVSEDMILMMGRSPLTEPKMIVDEFKRASSFSDAPEVVLRLGSGWPKLSEILLRRMDDDSVDNCFPIMMSLFRNSMYSKFKDNPSGPSLLVIGIAGFCKTHLSTKFRDLSVHEKLVDLSFDLIAIARSEEIDSDENGGVAGDLALSLANNGYDGLITVLRHAQQRCYMPPLSLGEMNLLQIELARLRPQQADTKIPALPLWKLRNIAFYASLTLGPLRPKLIPEYDLLHPEMLCNQVSPYAFQLLVEKPESSRITGIRIMKILLENLGEKGFKLSSESLLDGFSHIAIDLASFSYSRMAVTIGNVLHELPGDKKAEASLVLELLLKYVPPGIERVLQIKSMVNESQVVEEITPLSRIAFAQFLEKEIHGIRDEHTEELARHIVKGPLDRWLTPRLEMMKEMDIVVAFLKVTSCILSQGCQIEEASKLCELVRACSSQFARLTESDMRNAPEEARRQPTQAKEREALYFAAKQTLSTCVEAMEIVNSPFQFQA